MNEIKFRAIATDEVQTSTDGVEIGDFVYGYYYFCRMRMSGIIITELGVESGGVGSGLAQVEIEVDCKTVGQFTGLKDKNGTEIYKNDILSNKGTAVGVVKFGEYKLKDFTKHDRQKNHLGWYVEDENIAVESLECLFYNLQENLLIEKREDQQWIEIIGNIYEDKDLIK